MRNRGHNFSLECFGVKFSVTANRAESLREIEVRMPRILPVEWKEIAFEDARHRFYFSKNSETGDITVYKEDEILYAGDKPATGLDALSSRIRLTVAEFTDKFVFLHAGVIGWKDRAVIIPGKSFAGKTTLVAEFAKRGCEYFSDEYAMLDRQGLVHPFPKELSIRGIIDDYTQVDFDVERLGGRRARTAFPVGCILVAEYKKKARGKLRKISPGAGVLASLANSISVRQNPKFVLDVLNRAIRRSVVLKAERGEAAVFVENFFEYFLHREVGEE